MKAPFAEIHPAGLAWAHERQSTEPGRSSSSARYRQARRQLRAGIYVAMAEARAKVGQLKVSAAVPNDPAAFAQFTAAQDGFSSALSLMLAVSENYPALKATQNCSDLQAQIEATENRIAVERMRFNEAAQTFNTTRDSFPTVIVAWLLRRAVFGESLFQVATRSAEPARTACDDRYAAQRGADF